MTEAKVTTGRRERKREQTKQGLLQAAFNLFIEKGYDETTIDDIVAAADMAKVTFYYYFRSKEEIILEMKRATAAETMGNAQAQLEAGLPATEILQTLVNDLLTWTEQNWRIVEVFAAQRFAPNKKGFCDHEDTPPLVLFLESLVVHGQNRGEFRKNISPTHVAHYITMGIMNEHFLWMRKGRPEGTLKPSMDRCLDFMMNGLASSKE